MQLGPKSPEDLSVKRSYKAARALPPVGGQEALALGQAALGAALGVSSAQASQSCSSDSTDHPVNRSTLGHTSPELLKPASPSEVFTVAGWKNQCSPPGFS